MTIIKSATSVLVDGKDFGAVADTIANNPKRTSDVQRALVTFLAEKDAALAAKDAALAAKDAQAETDLAAAVAAAKLEIQTTLDALVQAGQAAHAAGDLAAIGAVLEQAATYTSAARAAVISKRKSELEAELAKLTLT